MPSLFVGLDVSEETTALCVVTREGQVLTESSVPTAARAIENALKPYRRAIAVVGHESGPISPWLHKELTRKRFPVVCLDARRTRAAMGGQRNKTDRNDARAIAFLLSRGFCAAAHVKSGEAQRLQTLLLFRNTLTWKVHDLDRVLGASLKLSGAKLSRSGKRLAIAWQRGAKDTTVCGYAEAILKARNALDLERQSFDALVRSAAKEDGVCRRLMTMPGVGPLVATTFRSAIDDPQRFESSRDVGAYFGLTPRRLQSGNSDYGGRVSKAGSAQVRSALFQAAHSLLCCTKQASALRDWGLRLAKARGLTYARIACSRKMAVILHRMWVTDADFEPQGCSC